MKAMTKNILKQLLKEFWIPSLVALIWTIANVLPEEEQSNFLDYIKTFGPAFFFVSWLLAQFWRVKKQLTVEQNFSTVESNIIALTEKLEHKTNKLINHVTGGDSYFYYKIGQQLGPDGWFMVDCEFVGENTLQNCEIIFFSKNSNHKDQRFELKSLNKSLTHKAGQQIKIDFKGEKIELTTFIFSCTGKEWVQMVDMQRSGNKVLVHSRMQLLGSNKEIEDSYEIPYLEKEEWEK